MKMLTSAELDTIMQTEFQRGFEACRAAAVKACRAQIDGPGVTRYTKTATECANEIARLPVPRFKPKT